MPAVSCDACTGSCQHYEECVEPLLQCGESGFTLAYGRRHCEAIQQMNSTSTYMPSWMMEWLHSHEVCLQQKVFELATSQACPTPNPISCLLFEASALAAFEECFTRNVSLLCNSHEMNSNSTTLAELIGTLTQLLGINNYYRHEVSEAITRAINNTCTHPNTDRVVSYVQPSSSNRIIFCAIVTGDDSEVRNFPITSYVGEVAAELDRPVEQFQYAGRDQDLCHESAPSAILNIPNPDYHYVMWEPVNSDQLQHNLEEYYYPNIGTASFFDFFELNALRSKGHCGDGLRQAGELCDAGVRNFFNEHGCNSSCMPCDNYECDTLQLVSSTCHPTVCGDGLRTSNEECDDGNDVPADGCTSCEVESNYLCDSPYNSTSTCNVTPEPPITTDAASTSSDVTLSTTTRTDTPTTDDTDAPGTTPPLTIEPIGSSAVPLNFFSYSMAFTVSLISLVSL